MGGLSVLYAGAMLSMFVALHAAGAVPTSLIFNLEPLVAIAAAAILLGERLMPVQMGGVALVIGALMLASLARTRDCSGARARGAPRISPVASPNLAL